MKNDPMIIELADVSLSGENSYVGKNRREFYKTIESNSPRNSQRKLRPGRTGQTNLD